MPVKVHHTERIIENICDKQEKKQCFVNTQTQENNLVYRLIISSSLTAETTDTAARSPGGGIHTTVKNSSEKSH